MSAAALTPRVRTLILCDEVIESDIEPGVMTLEGVRQQFFARAFPLLAPLTLYLELFSPRDGNFPGHILIVNEHEDKTIRYTKFEVEFDEANQTVAFDVELGDCQFPTPGAFSIQVWFSSTVGQDVLKGERLINIFSDEE